MRTDKDVKVDTFTKEAWEDNWSATSVEQILEIFKYSRVQRQLQIYEACLPRDKYILEGGCGLGPYLIHFRRKRYKMIGIDYNLAPLAKIAQYDKNIPVSCADIVHLPFRDSFFGAYLSLGVIEHFTEGPLPAIKEAHRVLAPGGYFIVQVPRASVLKKIKSLVNYLKRNKLIRKIFKKEPEVYYWEQYFTVSELNSSLREAGFLVKLVIPVDHEHALMDFCGFLFRNKKSFDGANKLGIFMGKVLQRYFPWSTAAGVIFVCRKREPMYSI